MKRFALIFYLVALSTFASAEKLNVLFICADDMNVDLGVYGHPQVKTPNLDRLAERGVVFERAYCQQSLCGPSRTSVMTGLRPEETEILTNSNKMREINPDVITLGQAFRQNGYFSARAGKIYHYGNPSMIGTDGHDDPLTWDEKYNPIGMDRTQQEHITRYGRGRQKDNNLGISMAWWDPVSEDTDHTDGKVASKIIELIEQKKDEPFFLAAGFFNPHCPYVAPKKYFDLYPLDQITMQDLEEAKRDLEDVPPIALGKDLANWPYYFADITIDQARKCKQAYFATQSFVDAQVGRLMDALEKNHHRVLVGPRIFSWRKGIVVQAQGLRTIRTRAANHFCSGYGKRGAVEQAGGTARLISHPDGSVWNFHLLSFTGKIPSSLAKKSQCEELDKARSHSCMVRQRRLGVLSAHRALPLHRMAGGQGGQRTL
jgi:hypothetical protein